MNKLLVVYFSRTGFTRIVARQLARACHADLEAIDDLQGRSHATSYAQSAFEALCHQSPLIERTTHAPQDYALVAVGGLVWMWNMASPVRSYLRRHHGQFERLALFCTYGGSGSRKVLQDMQALCDRPAVDTLALRDADIVARRFHGPLLRFTHAIQQASRQPLRGAHLGADFDADRAADAHPRMIRL